MLHIEKHYNIRRARAKSTVTFAKNIYFACFLDDRRPMGYTTLEVFLISL
jgi:hypothetical protein